MVEGRRRTNESVIKVTYIPSETNQVNTGEDAHGAGVGVNKGGGNLTEPEVGTEIVNNETEFVRFQPSWICNFARMQSEPRPTASELPALDRPPSPYHKSAGDTEDDLDGFEGGIPMSAEEFAENIDGAALQGGQQRRRRRASPPVRENI